MSGDRPVAVVTGGGGGIGAAIAEELGRGGWFVVTVDPLVSLDGSEQLPAPEETTAGRIVAAGGSARPSSVSVTDADGVRGLFDDLVAEHRRLDAVINVAGISRPTAFAKGSDEDWLGVLTVHLDGYRNVLEAALPIMAAAGRGRILGVTSGSGWRQADTGAYGCAKRAVAALTWQLGRHAPDGVIVNAMSPIAVTRMVTAALANAPTARSGAGAATGGLALGSMPEPGDLGPIGAHLVSDEFAWCSGEVVFVGGSEVAVVDPPRLLEVVRTDGEHPLAALLEVATSSALGPAEAQQASTGGSNPRLAAAAEALRGAPLPASEVRTCAIVSDRPEVSAVVRAALEARGVSVTTVATADGSSHDRYGFEGAARALAATEGQGGPVDAVVAAWSGGHAAPTAIAWERILAEHVDIVDQIHTDAAWARATADLAARAGRPIRLITLTDAVTAGGRSRAQSSAQLARAARRASDDRVPAFAISMESSDAGAIGAVGDLVAHLACSPDAIALAGAELVVSRGWIGLRSHPRPSGSISLDGTDVPGWFDDALRSIVR